MSTNNGCCGGTTTTTCDSTIAELPRYYPRQLITPDDLTLEQNYFRDRLRRHNRLLHGWGVVCGALVCPVTTTNSDGTVAFTSWQVKVQKGYILGPYGDEIILDCCRTVDLRTSGVSGVTGEPCVDAPDPWCSQVYTPPSTTNVFYLAVQYKQSLMRPVRVQPVGCGCDDTSCEYSRWHDGYQIGVLQSCPNCNACDPSVTPPSTNTLATGLIPACPDCSCGPWVCLAKVTAAQDGTIQQIDNNSCRRMVLSLANFWWLSSASAGASPTTITGVTAANTTGTPQVPADGATQVTLTVSGSNLEIGANVPTGPQVTYSFGSGITVTVSGQTGILQPNLSTVTLVVTAQVGTPPGPYSLTVVNPDCAVTVQGGAIQVVAPTTPAAAVAKPANQPAVSAQTGGGGKAPAKTTSKSKPGAGNTSTA